LRHIGDQQLLKLDKDKNRTIHQNILKSFLQLEQIFLQHPGVGIEPDN